MAAFKLIFLVSFTLFLLFEPIDSTYVYPSSRTHSTSSHKGKVRVKQVTANYGATCNLRCKIRSTTLEVVWFKDGIPLNITKTHGYAVKRHSKSKKEFLRISKMTIKHCGLYECFVENRKRGAWTVTLTYGKKLKCKRARREIDGVESACGKPASTEWSSCGDSRFSKCNSYAGLPTHIDTAVFIHDGQPMIQIGWKSPRNGYNDLWGYQVHIIGLAGNAGHQKCIQLNTKDGNTYFTFDQITFEAQYKLMLQSMPSKQVFQKDVYVKEKCGFKEFKLKSSCCFVSNLTSTVESGTIFLSWRIRCANSTIDIQKFRVTWTNIQNPQKCYGVQIVQSAYSEFTRPNCSIVLSEECQQYNYSIMILGIHESNDTARPFRVTLPYPKKIAVENMILGPKSNSTKFFVAVIGILLGLALFAFFFIYKHYFTKVVYKLPDPSQGLTVSYRHSQSNTEELIHDDGHKRVFLMSARCCEKCNWVLHCLGELLTSTGLADVRTDLWSENEISSCVLRWYEKEIREANCVVILASSKMATWNQRTMSVSERNGNDLLDIMAQLMLVSGEITRNPNSSKFIPAYFKYNGEHKDIPDFLNSRFAHKLPDDLNRLVYHVLNIEAIQPYRTRPIVVLGGNDHPFESRKNDLLLAVAQAEEEHRRLFENDNYNNLA